MASVNDRMRRSSSSRPRASARAGSAAPPLSARSPWFLGLAAIAALAAAALVTFPIYDPDLWQHLSVGRWILERGLPHVHVWSWPTYGAADAPPSWGFRVLLAWVAGGDPAWGVPVWRWVTTVAAFTLAWLAARAGGAKGGAMLPLVMIVACVLVYRGRSQARPETLVALLLAAQLAALEWSRTGRQRLVWLVPALTLLWSNAHVSWFLSPLVTLAYAIGALASRDPVAPATARRLGLVLLLSLAAATIHPYGWRAVLEPFSYLATQQDLAIFRGIAELRPVAWDEHVRDGLPILLASWALLLLWRARTGRFDPAEALLAVGATALALRSQRFLGPWSVVAAVFLARDAGLWARARAVGPRAAWARAAATAAVIASLAALGASEPGRSLGLGFDATRAPWSALEAMARAHIRGRGFAPFHFAGHLLWRFPGERDRLPYMDIHQSGGRERRKAYVQAFTTDSGWRALDAEARFDWVLLDRFQARGDDLADRLDRDSLWALVFADDAAALWVRRDGASGGASREALSLPAGQRNLQAMLARPSADSVTLARRRADLERMVAASPQHRQAIALLALTALAEGDDEAAADWSRRGLATFPGDPLLRRIASALGARR